MFYPAGLRQVLSRVIFYDNAPPVCACVRLCFGYMCTCVHTRASTCVRVHVYVLMHWHTSK